MTEETNNPDAQLADEQDAMLAKLIRSGGRREDPPQAHYDRVFAAAEQALLRKRAAQRRQRSAGFALAASVGIALIGAWFWFAPATPPAGLDVIRVVGVAEWRTGSADTWKPVTGAATLTVAGAELRTFEAAALSLSVNGTSVRLAGNSSMRFVDTANLALDQGKVYLDTGRDTGSAITVTTPVAVATDIGTQFEVRYIDQAYRLRVRSGLVQLAAETGSLDSAAGDQVTIDPEGEFERSEIAADDPDWRWAEDLAPPPGIEGEPLIRLLDWVERETGREIIFANPIVEMQSKQTIMHGSVETLPPLAALEVVLATTDFQATQTEDGKILISALGQTDAM